jgi:hypothetical protein
MFMNIPQETTNGTVRLIRCRFLSRTVGAGSVEAASGIPTRELAPSAKPTEGVKKDGGILE